MTARVQASPFSVFPHARFSEIKEDIEEAKLVTLSRIADLAKNMIQFRALESKILGEVDADVQSDLRKKKDRLFHKILEIFDRVVGLIADLDTFMIPNTNIFNHGSYIPTSKEIRQSKERFFLSELHLPCATLTITEPHEMIKRSIFTEKGQSEAARLSELKAVNDLEELIRAGKDGVDQNAYLQLIKAELSRLSSDESCKGRTQLIASHMKEKIRFFTHKIEGHDLAHADRIAYVSLIDEAHEILASAEKLTEGAHKTLSNYFVEHMSSCGDLIDVYIQELENLLSTCEIGMGFNPQIKNILAKASALSTLVLSIKMKFSIERETQTLFSAFEDRLANVKESASILDGLAELSRLIAHEHTLINRQVLLVKWRNFCSPGGLEATCFSFEKRSDALKDSFPFLIRELSAVKIKLNELAARLVSLFPEQEEITAILEQTSSLILECGADPKYIKCLIKNLKLLNDFSLSIVALRTRPYRNGYFVFELRSKDPSFEIKHLGLRQAAECCVAIAGFLDECDLLDMDARAALDKTEIDFSELCRIYQKQNDIKRESAAVVAESQQFRRMFPKLTQDAAKINQKLQAILGSIATNDRAIAKLKLKASKLTEFFLSSFTKICEEKENKMALFEAGIEHANNEFAVYLNIHQLFSSGSPGSVVVRESEFVIREKTQIIDGLVRLLKESSKRLEADETVLLSIQYDFEAVIAQIETEREIDPSVVEVPGYESFVANAEGSLVMLNYCFQKLTEQNKFELVNEASSCISTLVKDDSWEIQVKRLIKKIEGFQRSRIIPASSKSEILLSIYELFLKLKDALAEKQFQDILLKPLVVNSIPKVIFTLVEYRKELKGFLESDNSKLKEFKFLADAFVDLFNARVLRLQHFLFSEMKRISTELFRTLTEADEVENDLLDSSLQCAFAGVEILICHLRDAKRVGFSESSVEIDAFEKDLHHLLIYKSIIFVIFTLLNISKNEINKPSFLMCLVAMAKKIQEVEVKARECSESSKIIEELPYKIARANELIAVALALLLRDVFIDWGVSFPSSSGANQLSMDLVLGILNDHFASQAAEVIAMEPSIEKEIAAKELTIKITKLQKQFTSILHAVSQAEKLTSLLPRALIDRLESIKDSLISSAPGFDELIDPALATCSS